MTLYKRSKENIACNLKGKFRLRCAKNSKIFPFRFSRAIRHKSGWAFVT